MTTPTTIKLDGPIIDWLKDYDARADATRAEQHALIDQLKAQMDAAEAARKVLHTELWAKLAEVAPQTKEGNWGIDTDYLDQGLAFLKQKPESEDGDGLPGPLAGLLKALASGAKLGVAKVTVERE